MNGQWISKVENHDGKDMPVLRFVAAAASVLCLAELAAGMGICVWRFAAYPNGWIMLLFPMGVCALFAAMFWCNVNVLLSRYRIEPEGLRVKLPFRAARLIPWDDFQEVCLCYVRDSRWAKERETGPAICFIRKGEKPAGLVNYWKTHSPFPYRTILTVMRTEERLAQVRECCPVKVVDRTVW